MILARGARWVGLPELVGVLWGAGLQVLHPAFPRGSKKNDGMAGSRANEGRLY